MVLVSFAVAVSSCLGVVAAVSTAAAVSELRRRGPYTTPAAIDIEVSARFEALPPPKKPWARGTAALCLVGALLFFLTEYLQHPSYSFHFPGPHTGTCSLSDTKRAKFYGDLGGFSHATLTNSSVANKLIEAGLMEEWNFNSLEALTNFRMAGRLDPASSMAAWGEAYALGPRANRAVTKTRKPFPSFTPEDLPAVREASLRALRLANAAIADHPISDLAKKELAYAQAAQRRYEAGPEAEVQAAAEIEYGIALREIGHGWEDTNALAMAAEAFMNFSPWDYQHANGTLTWEAKQAEALIVEVLRLDPQNALALHLYIHLVEATNPLRTGKPSAAEAEASAERMTFRKGPWWTGFGHLLHMPSHTFLRIGRYHDAMLANIHANDVDQAAEAVCKTPYGPDHNLAMLINAASWSGEVQTAEQYSRQLTDMTRKFPLATKAQGGPHREATFLLLVWTMHARWSDILAAPRPGPLDRGLCPAPTNAYAMTAWHFARTLALAATANDSSSNAAQAAVQELAALQEAAGEVEPSEPTVPGPGQGIYGCDYHALVGIYAHVAEARVLMLQGQGASAEAPLKTALEIERGMGYMEPPRLLQPVRHYLGQLLLVLGRASEAQQVFEEDLAEHPENGFALQGLYRSQEVQNASQAIKETTARLKVAWQHADAPLLAACPALGL